jgi:hypothetical protein
MGQCGRPTRAPEQAQVVEISVMVPTVERGFLLVDFWSIDTAGESPSMKSTSGLSTWPRNWRA